MKLRSTIPLAAVISLGIFSGCSTDLAPLNTIGSSPAPTPVPPGVTSDLWDNFEANFAPTGPYDGGPSPIISSWSSDTAVSGVKSWKMLVQAPVPMWATVWSHWAFLDSSSMSPHAPLSFPNATQFKVWVKINKNVTISFNWVEGTTLGGDGETWNSPPQALVSSPAWQEVIIPLSAFTQQTTGNPMPAVVGMVQNPESVYSVWLYWNLPATYPAHIIYLDDIRFSL